MYPLERLGLSGHTRSACGISRGKTSEKEFDLENMEKEIDLENRRWCSVIIALCRYPVATSINVIVNLRFTKKQEIS
jgi:hypothetical protein